MQDPLKSGDSISIDSTIWYLEISANYTYGDATKHNQDVYTNSELISIPTSQGMVSVADENNAYTSMIDGISTFFYSINSSEKYLLAVKVSMVSLSPQYLTINVITTIVGGPFGGNFTFQPWDNWMYGNGEGMCNGTQLGKDAATEIQRRVMLRKAVPAGNYYYEPYPLNPVVINADFYPVPQAPPSNSCSHYMWWEKESLTNPPFHLCIPYTELNFYLSGTEYVIYHLEKPVGNDFINLLNMGGSLILNSDIWVHYGEVNYGILHQSSDPPEEF